jgi:hypothetical protein
MACQYRRKNTLALIDYSMGRLVINKGYMIAGEDPFYDSLGKRVYTMNLLGTTIEVLDQRWSRNSR